MGTLWTIEVMHHGQVAEAGAAIGKAFAEIHRIETLMSEWLPDSPVSQVNAAAGQHAVEVPDEVAAIIRRAVAYGARSEGAFDVTWRGLGKVWRFDEQFVVPSHAAVEQARSNVDYRGIRLEGNHVSLSRRGMSLGLGGIAKGYAVDRAARLLHASGFPDSLVAGAGDIRVSGTKNGQPWRLGVQDPRKDRGNLLGTLPLSGRAISTSGDYERFRIVDGVRYHHILDPRTGWPARECITVSVVADTAEQSDALSTAIFVLGPEKGLALARSAQIDVLIIDRDGHRYATGIYETLRLAGH
jgi:thiamine biosynthesis lipoprotein